MDQGHAEADVIKSMTQENPGFTADAATRFTHIAESTYCPQYVNAPPQQQPPPTPWSPPLDFPWPALRARRRHGLLNFDQLPFDGKRVCCPAAWVRPFRALR